MTLPSFLHRSARAAMAALLCANGAAHATVTVVTTPATFAAATSAPGVDSFTGLSVTSLTLSGITRSAGAYSYTASAPGDFFGGGGANPFLSPDNALDAITFDSFSSSVRGFAGNFFGSTLAGSFQPGSLLSLLVTDALGATVTYNHAPTGVNADSFVGFVSDAALVSVVLTAVQPAIASTFFWPSVDNLTLAAAVVAVPEPASFGLLLAGLAVIGVAAGRQSRRR